MGCGCGCGGEQIAYENWEETEATAAEYQGRKVTLNKPFRTKGASKKFGVYTKNEKGNVVLVRFGDPNMEIKRDDPKRRKAFRDRHNCSEPGPKWKAKYWSCRQWRSGNKVEAKMEDYIFMDEQGAIKKSEEIGFDGETHTSTTADGGTLYFPAKTEEEFIEWYRKNDPDAEQELEAKDKDDPCTQGYEQYGTKMKDGRRVPNCIPIKKEAQEEGDDVYRTPDEARERAKELGCSSIHTHTHEDGTKLYMPCESMEAYQEKKNGSEANYNNAPSCPPGKKMQDGKCVEVAVTLEIEIDEIATSIEASTGSTLVHMKGTAFHEGYNKNNWQITNKLAEMVAVNMVGADVTLNHPSIKNGRFTRNMTGGIDEAVVGYVSDAYVIYSGSSWEVKFAADIVREELFSSLESGLWLREGYGVSIGGTGIPDAAEEDDNGRSMITFSSNFQFDHLAIVHNPAYGRAKIDSVERKEVELSATVIYDSDNGLKHPKGEVNIMSESDNTNTQDNSAEMEALRAEKILLEAQVAEFENEKAMKAEAERTTLVEKASSLGMKGHDDLSSATLTGLIASWNATHPVVEEKVVEMKPVGASIDEEAVATITTVESKEVVANYFNQERIETPVDVYSKAYNTWVSAWNRTLTPAETQFRAKSYETIRGDN